MIRTETVHDKESEVFYLIKSMKKTDNKIYRSELVDLLQITGLAENEREASSVIAKCKYHIILSHDEPMELIDLNARLETGSKHASTDFKKKVDDLFYWDNLSVLEKEIELQKRLLW